MFLYFLPPAIRPLSPGGERLYHSRFYLQCLLLCLALQWSSLKICWMDGWGGVGVDKLRGWFKVAVYMGGDLVMEVRQAGRAGLELVNNSAVWNHHFGKWERD